jgi:hypothetical protein
MQFIRSRLIERRTTATEVIVKDLPINPLSHLVITLDGYNVTDEATLAEILAFINNVQVTKSGVTVIDLQSEDLFAVNAYLFRALPTLTGRLATDNYQRTLTLVVPFGRAVFNPQQCFPATRKGELTLRVDTTVPTASLDNSTISIDTVEMPDAAPASWLKCHRMNLAATGATGERDVELPIGNKLLMAQLRLTTVPAASSHTYGVDVVKLLQNNKEFGFAAADVMCLAGERALRVGCPDTTIAAQGLSPLNNIVWVDFDPTGDGQFAIDTAGMSSVKLRLNMGVNEATELTLLEQVAVG